MLTNIPRRPLVLLGLCGALFCSGEVWAQAEGEAAADTKSRPRAPRGVITLAEVTITGRLQKPIAAVDVQRIRAALTLSELKQPFLKRVERVIYKEPF